MPTSAVVLWQHATARNKTSVKMDEVAAEVAEVAADSAAAREAYVRGELG
jgi:hypothetical protein